MLGQFEAECAALIEIGLLEFRVRLELQTRLRKKTAQPGMVLIGILVERLSQQILLEVVLALVGVGKVAIAGVEALGQQEQTANAIAVILELARVLELVGVPLRVVGPDMLHLVGFLAFPGDILGESGGHAGGGFQVVGHAGQESVNLTAVHAVQAKPVVAGESLRFAGQSFAERRCHFAGGQSANFLHDHEHGILHGGIVDGTPVPHTPGDQDVEVSRDHAQFAQDFRFRIAGPERSKKHGVLQGEIVLCVVEDGFQALGQFPAGPAQTHVLAGVKVVVRLDQASEVGRLFQSQHLLLVAHPAVKLGADKIEVLRLGTLLSFPDFLSVLAAQPCLDGVGVLFLAPLLQVGNALAPDFAGLVARFGVGDVGEEVAFEHVGGRQGQPAVVHGLEDGVGVFVGIGGDFH